MLALPGRCFSRPRLPTWLTLCCKSCAPYHFSKLKKQGRAEKEKRPRTHPAASGLTAVSMAHYPMLSVTPADPPYELVSRNVSLLGVWRREAVLMPAPHTEDFISFLIFCLGAPAASNFPQLLGAVECVGSLGPFSVPTPFLTTWETSGPICNRETLKY